MLIKFTNIISFISMLEEKKRASS